MKKLLTVVIPTYNTEKFLEFCLDSLLQTDYLNCTEILIIDDGSNDSSAEIADSYAQKYSDIVSVIHKENGGHGSAINVGIQKASGKYFKVVDSDDWVEADGFNQFLKHLGQLECDLIATPFSCVYQKNGETVSNQKRVIEGSEKLESGKVYRFREHIEGLHIRMHEWTIKTELLKSNEIVLTEHSYYVDMQYILYPVPWVESLCILDFPVYCYRLGNEGQSVAVKSMQKNREQHRQVLESLLTFYRNRKEAGDTEAVLGYIAKGIAKMQADEVQIALSFPIGKKAKSELIMQEEHLKRDCPAAYEANEKFSIRLLRWSGYGLYHMAALMWRLVKR